MPSDTPSEPDAGCLLGELVARSLTGESVPTGVPGDPAAIVAALARAGWTPEALATRRSSELSAGRRWPTPVPAAERRGIGAAQLHVTTVAVLEALGMGPEKRLRDRSTPLSPRDQALMADRPPHHGNVG